VLKKEYSWLLVAICAQIAIASTTIGASELDVSEVPAQLGPRPFYLTDQLRPGQLKDVLTSCANNKRQFVSKKWSIGHRGAALQFPEHTQESYRAAARMGAGIIEWDVTFTADAELVCRHAQCDLHTTTNILQTALAQKCSIPFTPARLDESGNLLSPANARCCSSDITLAEFKSLKGKMDAYDPRAVTVDEYLGGTADFRTDLYASGGSLLSHRESIELIQSLGVGFTPELKAVTDGFGDTGLDQNSYAQKMIEEYQSLGVDADQVWAQSFNIEDVRLWIEDYPEFGQQAVLLDDRNPIELALKPPSKTEFESLKAAGLNIIAPPMLVLLSTDSSGDIRPSNYATNASAAGLDIISWTTERSGRIIADVKQGREQFYYGSTLNVLKDDGDILNTMHVLAQEVGIIGLFSDWPATTTFYANCMDLP